MPTAEHDARSPVVLRMTQDDPHDLARFVSAQAPVIDDAEAELRRGRKRTHWMWFVFPQIAGLGASPMARRYAIASLDEARAFLAHAVLGPRLVRCGGLVLAHRDRPLAAVLGEPDDRKFLSSMTLFARADPACALFREALAAFAGGREDPATLARLR